MIMEHFEVHKEKVEDILVDIQKEGAKALDFEDLPEEKGEITQDDVAMIEEIVGLPSQIEEFIAMNNVPQVNQI